MNERIRILDDDGQPIRSPASTRPPRAAQTTRPERQTPSRRAPLPLTLSALREMLNDRAQMHVAIARFEALVELRTALRDAVEKADLDFESRPAESQFGATATIETELRLVEDALRIADEYRDRWRRW
jgi:hypothetical protein